MYTQAAGAGRPMVPSVGAGGRREVMQPPTCLHSAGQSGEAAGCESRLRGL